MSIICKYCEEYIDKHNLKRHQENAKYCLAIQGKFNNAYKCICKKEYNSLMYYELHQKRCKNIIIDKLQNKLNVYKNRYKKYKEQSHLCRKELVELKCKHTDMMTELKIQKYEFEKCKNKLKRRDHKIKNLEKLLAKDEGKIEVYKNVTSKPITVNNNNTNNAVNATNARLANIQVTSIRPFTLATVREDLAEGKYTYEMFTKGLQGVVEFINNIIISDIDDNIEKNYACTDVSRYKFHRLVESKKWKSDNGARFLNKVLSEMIPAADIYYKRILKLVTDANTNDDRQYADIFQNLTKNTYFGITKDDSKERSKLFKQLRTEIRSIAAI